MPIKKKKFGKGHVIYNQEFEVLLQSPVFLNAFELVRTIKPLSVPFSLEVNGEKKYFNLRRTKKDYFPFLDRATAKGANFPQPILSIWDPEKQRHHLVISHEPVVSLKQFLLSNIPNKRKLAALRSIAGELLKLKKLKIRHGNIVYTNIFIAKGDVILLTNPEIDRDITDHIQSDLEQFREMLFHLERELDHEPSLLWEAVQKDKFINLHFAKPVTKKRSVRL
ncbi:MAG: hypothetical protein V1722_03575 [Candidatus Micrarchaeota archaeon]